MTTYTCGEFRVEARSAEELDAERIRNLLREAQGSNITLDKTTLEFLLRKRVDALAVRFAADPSSLEKLNDLRKALLIVKQMPFPVNLWSAQNHVYGIQRGLFQRTRRRAQRGDAKAQIWMDDFLALNELLSIKVQM